ncbi:MAG: outer membrane protein assembly factor BamA [Proteobacteria bacterium]|nr:outer membrane protein assembly factor BamA [Pseudomonadota bacterium]
MTRININNQLFCRMTLLGLGSLFLLAFLSPVYGQTLLSPPDDQQKKPFVKQKRDARKSLARITAIRIEGNVRVQDPAILEVMVSKVGHVPSKKKVAADIRAIYSLGYFSDVAVHAERKGQKSSNKGWTLVVKVKEKPAVAKISFQGFDEISTDDVEDKLKVKVNTIIDETLILSDVEMIAKLHKEKGYFLAKGSYELIKKNKHDVELIYKIIPQEKVYIGRVHLVGNQTFSDEFLLSFIQSQPFSHMKALFGQLTYQELSVERDEQLLSYVYQDRGFAEVVVGKTIAALSQDQRFVDLTFQIEEGQRYNWGTIDFSGDLLFDRQYLDNLVTTKGGDYFRISQLQESLKNLGDSYGDLGYAFVDVNPKITFDQGLAEINYSITKGKKVYFGDFRVSGNSKTRDHVILRELKVSAGDLYSRSGLRESQKNLESLGFFERVKFIRKIDKEDDTIIHYTVEVSEKSTGQIQGSLGYTPSGYTDANWFGQGHYEERNQSGRAYHFDTLATYSNPQNYSARIYFSNPRIFDSLWFFSTHLSYRMQNVISLGFDIQEKRMSSAMNMGRKIFEHVRGSFGFEIARTEQSSVLYLSDSLRISGDTIGFSLGLSRRQLNNYIDPTQGTHLALNQTFVGGPLGGDYSYQETELEAIYYHPLLLSENFATHFKLKLVASRLGSYAGSSPPLFKRYRLGGAFNLRGYAPNSITPRFVFWSSPFDYDEMSYYPKGGNRQLVFQGEYYVPLIQQAQMKALFFFDSGRVFDNNQDWTLAGLYSNIGFGVRWVTPMGPLRFEWAFPLKEDGTLGPYRLVFNIGY